MAHLSLSATPASITLELEALAAELRRSGLTRHEAKAGELPRPPGEEHVVDVIAALGDSFTVALERSSVADLEGISTPIALHHATMKVFVVKKLT